MACLIVSWRCLFQAVRVAFRVAVTDRAAPAPPTRRVEQPEERHQQTDQCQIRSRPLQHFNGQASVDQEKDEHWKPAAHQMLQQCPASNPTCCTGVVAL